MKLLPLLLYLIACLPTAQAKPAQAEAGPADPFATPPEEKQEEDETEAWTIRQVSVQVDWIRVPHLTANQLVRQYLKQTSDAGPLYEAVQKLIAEKKAERVDLTTSLVRSGQQTNSQSIVEHPYPTEFDPPVVAEKITVGGESQMVPIAPVTATYFASKKTGREIEIEATCSDRGRLVDLSISLSEIHHLGDTTWGSGLGEIKQSAFGDVKFSGQIFIQNGTWQLMSVQTPPRQPTPEAPIGAPVFPPDRLLLFVRPAVAPSDPPHESAKQALPHSGPRQVTVMAEWIELDTAILTGLLAKYPAFASSPGLREEIEPMLAGGRAVLVETAALQVRGGQRSKTESITEYPCPAEFDPPQGGQFYRDMTPTNAQPPPPPRILPVAPAVPQSFSTANLGTTLQVEATVSDDGRTIDLNMAPEIRFTAGMEVTGAGVAELKNPRFQTWKLTTQFLCTAGVPVMVGSFDALLPEGKKPPEVRTRKVVLFIRAIL